MRLHRMNLTCSEYAQLARVPFLYEEFKEPIFVGDTVFLNIDDPIFNGIQWCVYIVTAILSDGVAELKFDNEYCCCSYSGSVSKYECSGYCSRCDWRLTI